MNAPTEKRPETVPAIPLPFDVAIRAALETEPEPEESKPFGKRRVDGDDPDRYSQDQQ